MAQHSELDPYARPPDVLREVFKRCQKSGLPALDSKHIEHERQDQQDDAAFATFLGTAHRPTTSPRVKQDIADIPGLSIYPSLLPPEVQILLLDKLFHRDLSTPIHQTNVHLHHSIQYPQTSFFNDESLQFIPKDPHAHRPISHEQFLNKKLRWMTLGGQYDWTRKVYPNGRPPPFPPDIKQLVGDLFPMKAEAAIVNLYSPGDTLSLHRDVSEECDQPLVSISIGCDCVFVVGLDREDGAEPRVATLRLRSGDAVLMSGKSRFAWHGVPKVLAETCPDWLQEWPGEQYPRWKGWMRGKRVNVNVRQMFGS